MAIICTNNLLGNDTTGDGTPGNPYKSVSKALSLATGTDTVKVAGGQWTLVGTATVATRGIAFTTNGDYSAVLPVGTPFAVDTFAADGVTKEKTMFTVTAINSTTITTTGQLFPTVGGTYDIYRFDAIHYTQTATTGSFETLIAPTGATNIVVSGGWDSTFTTQGGWTVAKAGTTGASTTAALFTSTAINANGAITFDRFLCANTYFAAGGAGSFAIDTINFVNQTGLAIFPTSNFGIWNPASGFTTIIANNTNLLGTWNGAANTPTTLTLKQWINCGNSFGQSPKWGTSTTFGQSTGPKVKSLEIYWRSAGSAANTSSFSPLNNSVSTGDLFVDYIKIYLCGNTVFPLLVSAILREDAYRYVGDIETVIVDGTVSGIAAQASTYIDNNNTVYTNPLNINKVTGSLLDLKWCSYGQRDTSQQWPKLSATAIWGKDANGQVVVNGDNIPKYADTSTFVTGSNSLKMKIVPNITSTWWNSYIAGTLTKPNGTFTLTIKAKASKTVAVNDVRLLYSNAVGNEASLGAITLTTSWQDFTFSINSSTYPNWNLGNDGLMSILLRILSSETSITTDDYIWIDSVTVS